MCLLAALGLLLAGCTGREVVGKVSTPPNEEGLSTYTVFADGGTTGSEARYMEVARPDDGWVRHCFERAERGGGVPYYCTAGRTPGEARLGLLSIFVAAGLTWLAGLVLVGRLPARAPVEPVPAGSWLFRRTEVEKRSYRPVWREQFRMAVTGAAGKAAAAGILASVLLVLVLVAVLGAGNARDWALIGGVVHVVLFSVAYAGWSTLGNLQHEPTASRVMLGVGVGVGLFLAGLAVDRFLAFQELA
ncbi:MAG: hypothetical protein GEU80_12850 [Dehalococcoidia bacterium]|nr:hypothetical protein [Dehalococcoidia bacterium]